MLSSGFYFFGPLDLVYSTSSVKNCLYLSISAEPLTQHGAIVVANKKVKKRSKFSFKFRQGECVVNSNFEHYVLTKFSPDG